MNCKSNSENFRANIIHNFANCQSTIEFFYIFSLEYDLSINFWWYQFSKSVCILRVAQINGLTNIQNLLKFLKRHLYIFILFGPKYSRLSATLLFGFKYEIVFCTLSTPFYFLFIKINYNSLTHMFIRCVSVFIQSVNKVENKNFINPIRFCLQASIKSLLLSQSLLIWHLRYSTFVLLNACK